MYLQGLTLSFSSSFTSFVRALIFLLFRLLYPKEAQQKYFLTRQPGMEYRHHLRPSDKWICLLGSRHRLLLAAGIELARQQHHGSRVLLGLLGLLGRYLRATVNK